MTIWTQWVRRPQDLWPRKALFQVHLWTGIGVGLYIFVISVTGSALVYRNELFLAVTPRPIVAVPSGERLTDEQLKDAARRAYPGFEVTQVRRARNPDQAVDVSLQRGGDVKTRMFDPYTGKDLGGSVPLGVTLVSGLIDLHDNLLAGRTGRAVNGVGAVFLIVLCLTGAAIWWPGIRKWRGSVWPDWKANWKRFSWTVHSAVGFWFAAIVLLWGVTGVYLCFSGPLGEFADRLEPLTEANAGFRVVDRITYWLAYLHFGRFGGRIPGCGPICASMFKIIWAAFGLTLPVMFVTGAVMWWTRVLRKARKPRFSPSGRSVAHGAR